MDGLDINAVNFYFILLSMIVYFNPIKYMKAIYQAASEVSGIILQFSFYAGIQRDDVFRIGSHYGDLAGKNSDDFHLPRYCSAGGGLYQRLFPSDGGEFMAIGESISRAGVALGVPAGKFITAYAAGDAWTNLFNPFWAIPLLAITQVKARDMFGSCIVIMVLAAIPLILGLTLVPY